MPSPIEISVADLSAQIGSGAAPAIVDVRTEEDFVLDARLLPASRRRAWRDVSAWAHHYSADRPVVVVCQKGLKLSHGVAAWLRQMRVSAQVLAGGFEAWRSADGMTVSTAHDLARDPAGRSIWVTRSRPKVDRIACPWLIRRFVDEQAVFLFVAASEVAAVAERFGATPFDIDGVFWSHRGELCSFDTMIEELGLNSPALDRLAAIVRGADTARPDLAPQAAGLLAVSLGLSRLHGDDLRQLDAAMGLYDALYIWCRDAVDESHNWPSTAVSAARVG